MKIKGKYRDTYRVRTFERIGESLQSVEEHYERSAECWLIGVTIDQKLYTSEQAIIALGDGVVKVVPLSSVRITDECYFTAPEQEHLIAKYAIDENGYPTGENLLAREEEDK